MKDKRALIVTVGTGTRPDVNIVNPLVKTVKDSRPDFLILVVTKKSRQNAESIVGELKFDPSAYLIEPLEDFDDFQEVFRSINQIFYKLNQQGFDGHGIQLDFTSGTKAMSGGAVLSAVYNQCSAIKYISGKRKDGIVIDDTEKFLTINPSAIFSLRDIQQSRELILRLRFLTADEILSGINFNLLDPYERELAKNFRLVAQAYSAWDRFDHRTAYKKFSKINQSLPGLQCFQPASNAIEHLTNLARIDNKKQLLLIDLFNNAVRRGIEGKFDDAVARLYRAAELFAQLLLEDEPFEIDSSNVDLKKVPESIRNTLENLNNIGDGRIKIGLEMDYRVLDEFGHPAGKLFLENKQLRSRLSERNTSILAHGLKPVSYNLYRKLAQSLLNLFLSEYNEFAIKAQAAQFPWIKNTH